MAIDSFGNKSQEIQKPKPSPDDIVISLKPEEPKTRQQEKAQHVLFKQIANYCMEHGITVKMVLEHMERYRIDVDEKFVKGTYRAILNSRTDKTSTSQETKEDIKANELEFSRLWSEITGVDFEFPSAESKSFNEYHG